jgi:hypothetical protein
MPDHVHILISIPPKYAVSQVVGYIKGKSAIHLARTYGERKQNYVGQHFWARGYLVSQSAGTRPSFGTTFAIRKWKMSAWTNCGLVGELAAERRRAAGNLHDLDHGPKPAHGANP